MIRIYLDWNIYSYMRQKRDSIFTEIEDFLLSNKNSVLIPYSPAHLQDLKRSYFYSEKGKRETIKDLGYLTTITNNHCLYYNYKEKFVNPRQIDPLKYFQEIYVENANIDLFDFDSIFDKDDPLGKLWQSYWKLLQMMPSGIELKTFEDIPEKYGVVNDIFKNTKKENNFGNLMKDMIELMEDPEQFEKIFKSVRETSNKDMKIKTNNDQWGDPFTYLTKILKQNKIEKNFFDLTTETIENSNKKASRFDYFSNYYIQLDMFGYKKDKKVANLIDDASHSFYGAHCDIFLTDDKNTYHKSKALYKQLNISTEVLNSNEFFANVRKMMVNRPEDRIAKQVIHCLENSFLLLDTVDDKSNPARIYRIEPYFKNYFNRMQISEYQNETVLTFYKKRDNYSDIYFWIEIEQLVNSISEEYGIDLNQRLKFKETEKEELNNEKWLGRLWNYGEVISELDCVEHPFGMVFRIRMNYR